jgi:hypothetical protein
MLRLRSPSRAGPRRAAAFLFLLLVLAAPPVLEGQDTDGDAMAFPRQILDWYLAGEGDRVWEYAGETMRTLAESPAGLTEAGAEITEMMGARTGVLDEQIFEHPEGGGWHVYVGTLSHAQVPEMFWIVIFSPTERQIQMILPQPRQTILGLFPQVRVP